MNSPALHSKFARLAVERLERLGNLVLSIEQRGRDESLAREAQREIHTLKGEARILGFDATASLAHAVEELLHRSMRESALEPDVARALLDGFDLLGATVKHAADAAAPRVDSAEYEARIGSLSTAAKQGDREVPAERAAEPAVDAESKDRPREQEIATDQLAELTRVLGELRGLHARWRETTSVLRSIDESAQRGRRATDVASARAAIEETRALAQRGHSDAREHAYEFDSVLERLGDLAWSLRVVSVDPHLARYPRAARDLADALGRQVRLDIVEHGARVEKPVLALLDELIVHLLRNAVDHGIESPDERVAAGKDRVGRVRIAVRPTGARVELSVSDDGRGIDPVALRRAAVERRTLNVDAADAASDDEIIQLLFSPGFTTRANVSETSGRGVGLDAVRERAMRMGGQVHVESSLGRGTTFRVDVPTVASMSRVLIVEAGGTQVAIPSSFVHSVASIAAEDIEDAGVNAFVRIDGTAVPLLDLARSMDAPSEPFDPTRAVPVVTLVSSRGLKAFRVSRLRGEREAVQLPVGAFLERNRFVRSVSLLENGDMALGIDPATLVASRAIVHRDAETASPAQARAVATRVRVGDHTEHTRHHRRFPP